MLPSVLSRPVMLLTVPSDTSTTTPLSSPVTETLSLLVVAKSLPTLTITVPAIRAALSPFSVAAIVSLDAAVDSAPSSSVVVTSAASNRTSLTVAVPAASIVAAKSVAR